METIVDYFLVLLEHLIVGFLIYYLLTFSNQSYFQIRLVFCECVCVYHNAGYTLNDLNSSSLVFLFFPL